VAVRAVIDTNIWVSSLLNPSGFPAKLRKSFEEGAFKVIISAPILEELADVLARPRIQGKYEITGDDIKGLLELLEQRAEDVLVLGDVEICRDKDDNFVIETAIKGQAEYLVTRDDDIKFDKEVLSYLSRHSITVVSLSKFLAVIDKI
jgi:uncharacterized protein